MKSIKLTPFAKIVLIAPAIAWSMIGGASSVRAQANPPMWKPMTMLNVTYDTNAHRLSVVDEATLMGTNVFPVLTVATNGTYDPSKPWGVLNGTAYSRRLGWDDANKKSTDSSLLILNQITNYYGTNAGIWIECLSHTPALNAYLAVGKYGVNATGATNTDGTPVIDTAAKVYTGIFGTAGSSTKWKWDGQMDHNTYAVSLTDIVVTNQLFTATYKVYVGDAAGNEILNADSSSASTTKIWTWQGPAALIPPSLTVASKIVIEWPGTSANFVAETAETPDSPSWTRVPNTPVTTDGKTMILIEPTGSHQFFRLRSAQ